MCLEGTYGGHLVQPSCSSRAIGCFHPLYAFFLSLSLAKSSVFIRAGLLAFLPDFAFVVMELSWAWRRWSLNIQEVSWALLPSSTLAHKTLLRRSLKMWKSVLLNSRTLSLLFSLLPTPRILNSTILCSLNPWLPLTFTTPTSLSLLVSYEVQHSTSPCWVLYHLEEELTMNALQEPPGLFMPCCVVPPVVETLLWLSVLKSGL